MVAEERKELTSESEVMPQVQRLYANSEVRTPLICCLQDGDPLRSIEYMARQKGCAVWSISMDSAKNEQNALDYLEVGLQNGDWVYLTHNEKATSKTLREIALQLTTVAPDPKHFPKRELFRLWLSVEGDLDVNDTITPIFPTLLMQNCIYARAEPKSPRASRLRTRQPVEPTLQEVEHHKRMKRRENQRDEDSESDHEDAAEKRTGLWFHRSVDFYEADKGSVGAHIQAEGESIFDAVESGDVDKIGSLVSANIDCLNATKAGMTPLLWGVMCDNINVVQLLLQKGADPNQRRLGNGMPAVFMHIEQVPLLQLLLEHGADLNVRYEGCLLRDHPDTSHEVQVWLKQQETQAPA